MSGDPHVLYGDYKPEGPREYKKGTGAIRAFGEHKGSGLALMCELLGGALTGNGASQLPSKWSQGMFSFYIDAAKVDPENFFPAEVTRMIGFVKGSKPLTAGDDVLVPGEQEDRYRAERRKMEFRCLTTPGPRSLAVAREVGIDGARLQKIELL